MFSIPGILSQKRIISPPSSTILYMRGNALFDLSTNQKTITPHSTSENQITFDTSDQIYGSYASMVIPAATKSYLKFPARISGVSLGNSAWTIELWVKRVTSSPVVNLLCFTPDNYSGTLVNLQPFLGNTGQNTTGFWEHTGTVRVINSATTVRLPQNQWTHLAICRSGTTLRLFRDGTVFQTISYSLNNTNFSTVYLGVMAYGSDEVYDATQVKIAHLHIAQLAYYTANFTANKANGFS